MKNGLNFLTKTSISISRIRDTVKNGLNFCVREEITDVYNDNEEWAEFFNVKGMFNNNSLY